MRINAHWKFSNGLLARAPSPCHSFVIQHRAATGRTVVEDQSAANTLQAGMQMATAGYMEKTASQTMQRGMSGAQKTTGRASDAVLLASASSGPACDTVRDHGFMP